MATSLMAMRRIVGNLLGDVTPLTATVAGTTTTFIDTISLSSNIESPRNRDIVFTAGSGDNNIGLIRRITNYDLSAGYVVFDAIPDPTPQNSYAEMYNFRGKGWRITEYDQAMDQACLETRGIYKEKVVYDVALNDITDNAIDANDAFNYVSSLDYLDYGTTYVPIPAARNATGKGWWIQDEAVVLTGYDHVLAGAVDGTFRVTGYIDALPITSNDSTNIPPEWLSNRAAAILCMSALDRDQGNFARGQHFQRQADMWVAALRTRVPSTTRRVV